MSKIRLYLTYEERSKFYTAIRWAMDKMQSRFGYSISIPTTVVNRTKKLIYYDQQDKIIKINRRLLSRSITFISNKIFCEYKNLSKKHISKHNVGK